MIVQHANKLHDYSLLLHHRRQIWLVCVNVRARPNEIFSSTKTSP